MIAFPRSLLISLVLDPQADPEVVDVDLPEGETHVALRDVDDRPLDAVPQNLAILATTTTQTGFSIGNGVELRHTIDVGVDVQHGDAGQAEEIRDAIIHDLCLRAVDQQSEFMAAVDPAGEQSVARVRWSIDWRPLYSSTETPNSSATITFTIDTDLDRDA